MPYEIICDGPAGTKHCRVVKKDTGKTVAHTENKKDAGLYVAFAERKIEKQPGLEKKGKGYGQGKRLT